MTSANKLSVANNLAQSDEFTSCYNYIPKVRGITV